MIVLSLFVLLFWFTLVGKITTELVIFGIVLTLLVFWGVKIMIPNNIKAYLPAVKLWKLIKYIGLLIYEVIMANIDMIKIVLSPDISDLKPALGYFKADLNNEFSKMALANSITLTPGTITVYVNENHYMVHALDKSMLEGISSSSFVEKLQDLEK